MKSLIHEAGLVLSEGRLATDVCLACVVTEFRASTGQVITLLSGYLYMGAPWPDPESLQ